MTTFATAAARGAHLIAAICLLLVPVSAAAQTRPPHRPARPAEPAPHAGSWEVSGGLAWQGGFDLGTVNAEETRNPGTGSGPLDLFTSDTTLGSGFGLEGRISGYLSSHVAIEGGVRVTRPKLKIALSNDFESAPGEIAEETLTQWVIDGSALWHFGDVQHARVVPFVGGGAGYIRDLHADNELMETGVEYHALGGVKVWFSDRPRRWGLRGEAGVSVRDGGFGTTGDAPGTATNALDLKARRTVPTAGVSLIYLF